MTGEPTRLWYSVGTLEVLTDDASAQGKRHPTLQILLTYRTKLDPQITPKMDKRIDAAWAYLGALRWCLSHARGALDNTALMWRDTKGDHVLSNQGMALEYFAVLLALTGMYAQTGKEKRKQHLRGDCAYALELCAQCCEHAALHYQRHLSLTPLPFGFKHIPPHELMERAKLLRLCVQQESIEMGSRNCKGALHLMRALGTFTSTAKQAGMRLFAFCMHTDWKISTAQHLAIRNAGATVGERKTYHQTLGLHQFIVATVRLFQKKLKKYPALKGMATESFLAQTLAAMRESTKMIARLKGERAQHLLVTAAPLQDENLDSGAAGAGNGVGDDDLFAGLDPTPVDLGETLSHSFQEQLTTSVSKFSTSDAPPASTTPSDEARPVTSLIGLDEFVSRAIPPALVPAVCFGLLAERRRQLEEKRALWPSPDVDADLAEAEAGMAKIVLSPGSPG